MQYVLTKMVYADITFFEAIEQTTQRKLLRHEPVISYKLVIKIFSCCNPGFYDLSLLERGREHALYR